MRIENVNIFHASILIRHFVDLGVRRAVISPGSRSTPLALAVAREPRIQSHVLVDERSAAFFALGLSKLDRLPTLLICTSGTAAANYFPAVIEASQSDIPLIILTADRPAELRGTGAPQTIDQIHLYGKYPREFINVPAATLTLAHGYALRAIARQAFTQAMEFPAGPVHVNVSFDEPLAPVLQDSNLATELWEKVWQEDLPLPARSARTCNPDQTLRIAERIRNASCGMIVAGPQAVKNSQEAEALFHLARTLGWPVFADIGSGLRFFSPPVIPLYDIILREKSLCGLAPDFMLMLGMVPVSKTLHYYLNRHHDGYALRIRTQSLPGDPLHLTAETMDANVESFCREVAREIVVSRDSLLYEPLANAAGQIRSRLSDPMALPQCEGSFVLTAVRALPDDANVVLANSMSIRYADTLCAAEGKAVNVFVMRGASGIDGTISHAAGIARASGKPTLLITGDLAFWHDMNGLMAARDCDNLTILLVNNNGGGIFHFLPVHEHLPAEDFERLHGTPHDAKLKAVAQLYDLRFQTVNTPAELSALWNEPQDKMRIIEVKSDREQNRIHFQQWIHDLRHSMIL